MKRSWSQTFEHGVRVEIRSKIDVSDMSMLSIDLTIVYIYDGPISIIRHIYAYVDGI